MMDETISRKLKGRVLDSRVVPASVYGLETVAQSELHQNKLQLCENNWIRSIAGGKSSGENESEIPARRSKSWMGTPQTHKVMVSSLDYPLSIFKNNFPYTSVMRI